MSTQPTALDRETGPDVSDTNETQDRPLLLADGPEVQAAIDVVARRALADAAQDIEWSDYPEIGEDDWYRVVARLDARSDDPDVETFEAAYELLERRAAQSPEAAL